MLRCFYGADYCDPRFAVLEKGTNSQSWTVSDRGGRRLVLRCALGNNGHAALEAMAAAAVAVVAAGVTTKTPLPTGDGDYTVLDDNGRPWQCWTWLDGHRPAGSATDAAALGQALRHFHRALSDWLSACPDTTRTGPSSSP